MGFAVCESMYVCVCVDGWGTWLGMCVMVRVNGLGGSGVLTCLLVWLFLGKLLLKERGKWDFRGGRGWYLLDPTHAQTSMLGACFWKSLFN